MPSPDAASLLSTFINRLDRLRSVRDSVDQARLHRRLRHQDVDHIYESTFLGLCSAFERFQEDLFYSCVLGQAGIAEARSVVRFRNRAEAERVLLAGDRRGFLVWSRMPENIERSSAFITRGRPFSRLQRRSSDLNVLTTGARVRNAIAHEGQLAMERFRALPLGSLPARFRTPAGFLRQSVAGSTQHETLVSDYARIASALAAKTDRQARRLLRREDAYPSGADAPRGTYKCRACGTRVRHMSGSLAECACNPGSCLACGNQRSSKFERKYPN